MCYWIATRRISLYVWPETNTRDDGCLPKLNTTNVRDVFGAQDNQYIFEWRSYFWSDLCAHWVRGQIYSTEIARIAKDTHRYTYKCLVAYSSNILWHTQKTKHDNDHFKRGQCTIIRCTDINVRLKSLPTCQHDIMCLVSAWCACLCLLPAGQNATRWQRHVYRHDRTWII